jgi:hypothetical protein
MSTKIYASFISEQQSKLRGAGLLDEAKTHTTINWHVPVFNKESGSDSPTGDQDTLEDRHNSSKQISDHFKEKHGAEVSSQPSNYRGYKTTKYSIKLPNEHAEKVKEHLLDADLTSESGRPIL